MKRNGWMHLVLGGALVLSAATARAQGPGGGHHGRFGGPMELMGFEGMHGGKVVKGAPFSAATTATTNQTLQDGTTINRIAQGYIYRDSEGRIRRDVTFTGVGALAATGGTHKIVAIFDPVAGVHYMLDADKKIAYKMTLPAKDGAGTQAFEQKMQARQQQEQASGALKVDALGTQPINGVSAEGTRNTHTIAAGEIGNSAPIQIVSERWYSADLQTVVQSSRTDPRFGTTTFSLTNIQKTAPAATLFIVPADYTVQTGGPGHGHHGGPEAAPPPGT
ncbi:MAG TPA: hypothetical protein VHT31_06080 [Candidatus Acidoferrum sp.]|jgi:hypothetical protein|nr:hypothetical protein [Candidatus Acidoferrum sp.]